MKRTLWTAVLATGLGATAAMAAPAVTTGDLNVRAGQGTSHPVVGVLPQGTVVDVRGCGDGWCFVPELGGYASASYLQPTGRRAMRMDRGPRYVDRAYRYAPYAGPMAYDPIWRDGPVYGGGVGVTIGAPGIYGWGWHD
jgi:uncharacterized protein YraI